jgi:hypothetical protein
MTAGFKPVFTRKAEMLNALERVFIGADSPGVKMAAGFSIELLTGVGQSGRPLPVRVKNEIQFVVSITVLSASMDQVLIRREKRGDILPRVMTENSGDRMASVALSLAADLTGDGSVEMALLGRPNSVELWDDDLDRVRVGLNFLVIARSTDLIPKDQTWVFVPFHKLNLNAIDPREALALSEMLTTMGIDNPYDMKDGESDDITSAA